MVLSDTRHGKPPRDHPSRMILISNLLAALMSWLTIVPIFGRVNAPPQMAGPCPTYMIMIRLRAYPFAGDFL